MSGSINKVILIGRLGQDPEIKYLPSGVAVANFTVATSESWKDKNTGEKVEKTEWHRIVAFNKIAEIIGEYLTKGRQVYIDGSIQTRSWEVDDGSKRYITEIKVRNIQFLGSNPGSSKEQYQAEAAGFPATPDDDDMPF